MRPPARNATVNSATTGLGRGVLAVSAGSTGYTTSGFLHELRLRSRRQTIGRAGARDNYPVQEKADLTPAHGVRPTSGGGRTPP